MYVCVNYQAINSHYHPVVVVVVVTRIKLHLGNYRLVEVHEVFASLAFLR